jgi:hypothetical protein
MRIFVVGIERGNDCCVVRFSSPHGHASAHWQGDDPELGQCYDVEIDLPPLDLPDVVLRKLPNDLIRAAIREVDGWVHLVGVYSSGPGPRAGAVRLDESLVLLDGAPFDWAEGTPVQIEARFITLYPFNL